MTLGIDWQNIIKRNRVTNPTDRAFDLGKGSTRNTIGRNRVEFLLGTGIRIAGEDEATGNVLRQNGGGLFDDSDQGDSFRDDEVMRTARTTDTKIF